VDKDSIIPMLVALIGALGLKEGWNIWKKKIDNSASFKSSLREDNKKRITELENKVAELYKKIELLMEENATLKANIARLEERILITAKNRIKTNEKV
tara:strand:- start:304 stop:597 length:294 start_codon:yes stop_codon:yes gene_type:complete